jgi:hypothetical protein
MRYDEDLREIAAELDQAALRTPLPELRQHYLAMAAAYRRLAERREALQRPAGAVKLRC